jgi:uncharacterized protein YndB with AHSA1/START domain
MLISAWAVHFIIRRRRSEWRARFLEIDAPHRLAFTWIWDGEFDETRVSVEFRSVPDGTEIVLMHTGNADETARDNHAQGWRDCLARLGPSLG